MNVDNNYQIDPSLLRICFYLAYLDMIGNLGHNFENMQMRVITCR